MPFTFVLYQKRMFIDKSVAPDQDLKEKSEVISINGVPVLLILDSLLLLTKGDGKNDGKRLHSLQLSGLSKYEPFDVYYPLAFPNESNNFILEVVNEGSADVLRITVPAVSRRNRLELIEQKYGKQPSTDDDLWQFKIIDKNSAYLKIGTFVLRNLSFDYEDFIKDAFEQIVDLKIANLILDIRGNEGGMDEVNLFLAGFLSSKPLALSKYRQLLVYSKAPDSLRPYISTWDDDFYDRTDDVIRVDNRFFTWKEEQEETFSSPFPENKRFSGRLWILVDEANSSATFFLAQAAKENSLGTLVGTQTGGNRMGTNGGQLFFCVSPTLKLKWICR
ncbi:MAG: hypothetical protein IPJ75_12655 [Ignavibacteriales bacterium]|nr:hypothetical protein [Ignavibacteriales bacterium]